MARQTHQVARSSGSHPVLPPAAGSLDMAMEKANIASGEQCAYSEGVFVVAANTGENAATVTIESLPGKDNRKGDIVYSVKGSTAAVFGPFRGAGWMQEDNLLFFRADNQTVEFGCFIPVL